MELHHMYIRFVVHEIDPDSGRRLGVFHALRNLREDGKLLPWENDRADEIKAWFNTYLDRPASFNRSSRPNRIEKALSWFKDSASRHIALMREMVEILESHSVAVEAITTDRPGYITYEDDYQIAAEPFADTPT
jgi:hypothetical protein